jgi:erythritol kinase (D-erythritol 1-phosphate-forming)
VMTALGAGVRGGAGDAACSTVGSTGVHMRAKRAADVHLNAEGTGYVICLPVPDVVTQVQTNMAATLNIDWALGLAADVLRAFGQDMTPHDLVGRIDGWLAQSAPGQIVYHPYISDAGERGPFVNAEARAAFVGLSMGHRYPDLLRAVAEGLGMAMRDCYVAMGDMPSELRLTGGAARSPALRGILSAAIHAPVRVSARDEAGAAGAAMMAAVAIGVYPDMDACIAEWVTPLLGEAEAPDPALVAAYDRLFPAFTAARYGLVPAWDALAAARRTRAADATTLKRTEP